MKFTRHYTNMGFPYGNIELDKKYVICVCVCVYVSDVALYVPLVASSVVALVATSSFH